MCTIECDQLSELCVGDEQLKQQCNKRMLSYFKTSHSFLVVERGKSLEDAKSHLNNTMHPQVGKRTPCPHINTWGASWLLLKKAPPFVNYFVKALSVPEGCIRMLKSMEKKSKRIYNRGMDRAKLRTVPLLTKRKPKYHKMSRGRSLPQQKVYPMRTQKQFGKTIWWWNNFLND